MASGLRQKPQAMFTEKPVLQGEYPAELPIGRGSANQKGILAVVCIRFK
jgi:hypothetical protein